MARKTGLESGRNPQTVILDKNGRLRQANGLPFRGLVYPLDLISYECGTFDIIKDATELRSAIERIGETLGKVFDTDNAIADALLPAPVRARDENAVRWVSQALDPGFLMY